MRGTFPAASWIYAAETKKEKADDATLVMSDISRKALKLTRDVEGFSKANPPGPSGERGSMVVDKLVSGEMSTALLSAADAKARTSYKHRFSQEVVSS